jgi:TRAP-type C4-dicarboxylate transport system substrate-binding protein
MLRKSIVALGAAAALALAASPASAQKQTLKMAYWAGPAHHMVKTQEAWIKTIEGASGGNLTVEVDKAALAKHGLADKEFTDTKLLNVFVHGPGTIHTLKPVKTLEEIKGIKIRAGGAGVPISQALGMSAISATATEAHEMLSRGTVDGVLFPYEAVDSFRLSELVKAHLEVPGGLYTATFVIVVNKDAFGKLTPANQAALLKASGEAGSTLFGKAWDAADARGKEGAKKRGDTIQTLAPAELERWRPMLKFVRDAWLKKAKDRGLDGEMLLKDLEATIKASS